MATDPRTAYQRGRILAAIANEAMTAQQLADQLHLTRDGINIHLKAMKEASPRLVHVSGWVYNRKGGRPAPEYRPGDKADSVYVARRTPTRCLKMAQNLAIVKRELRVKSMTSAQMGEVLGVSPNWARHFIAKLRADGEAYICGWKRLEAGIAPIYTLGNRKDAPRPRYSHKESYKRIKAKRKTDPEAQERYERLLRRRRMQSHIDKLKAIPQTWCAPLMEAA